jgi:hypothetical protein
MTVLLTRSGKPPHITGVRTTDRDLPADLVLSREKSVSPKTPSPGLTVVTPVATASTTPDNS